MMTVIGGSLALDSTGLYTRAILSLPEEAVE